MVSKKLKMQSMSYKIKISKKKALKKWTKLEKPKKYKIKEIIFSLSKVPYPYKSLDVKKLKGIQNAYKIRVGKIRILYNVFEHEKMVYISFKASSKGINSCSRSKIFLSSF